MTPTGSSSPFTREPRPVADGTLIDASETACQEGIRLPTAITLGVWSRCIDAADVDNKNKEENEQHLRAVLRRFVRAARQALDSDEVHFTVPIAGAENTSVVALAKVGPGDDGEQPVLTLMFEEED